LHVWSLLAISINSASSLLIIIEDNQKLFIKISLVGAISNIILNFFLIDLYGVLGAAYSTLISYFFVSTYTYLVYRRLLKINV
jgi:O-antigen/teichoic acid export membrane protein